jgi:hypothetical protein
MQLYDTTGYALKLTLVGYQFPEMTHEPYDSNWLIVEVDVTTPDRSWRASEPCLLTYEVEQLAQWLEQAADDTPDNRVCRFIEPCLQLELHDRKGGDLSLRVVFDLELRPDWQTERTQQSDNIWIDLQVDRQKLLQAAQALREQLARFPQRAEQ